MDFSKYKHNGNTPMYGRDLDRLLDAVYYTQSHHSRFLQLADVVVYPAGRYLHQRTVPAKWHDREIRQQWKRIKASAETKVQHWP